MRLRIEIDTDDATSAPNLPYTLRVYQDSDNGRQSRQPLDLGSEEAMIGDNIYDMLRDLALCFDADTVAYKPYRRQAFVPLRGIGA